jgi:hypothetical protein
LAERSILASRILTQKSIIGLRESVGFRCAFNYVLNYRAIVNQQLQLIAQLFAAIIGIYLLLKLKVFKLRMLESLWLNGDNVRLD